MKNKIMCLAAGSMTVLTAYGQSFLIENACDNEGIGNGQVVTASATLGGANASGALGNGWNADVEVGLGVVYNLSASMPGDSLVISGSGLAGVDSTVDVRKNYSGLTMDSGTTYEVTLSVADASLVNLLGDVDITIGKVNGGVDTIFCDTSTGIGLLGAVDLVGLFGSSNTATFQFDGVDFNPGDELFLELGTDTLAGVIDTDVVFSGLSIESLAPVPEPSTSLLGALGFAGLLFRRNRN